MSVFAVSRVRLDLAGNVTDVMWGVVDTKSNHWVSPEVEAPVAEVLDAIQKGDYVVALFPTAHGHMPERQFVSVEIGDGTKAISLDGPARPGREIQDMDRLQP